MSAALDIARAFEAAWQGKDFEKARSYLAEDVVLDGPFGRETNAARVIEQYAGFTQVVTGPAREIAAFGDGEHALIMSDVPTVFAPHQVSAVHYTVRGGKITSETMAYDATAIRAQAPPAT